MTNVVKTQFFPPATLRWNQSTYSPRAPSGARQCFNALAASARRTVRRPRESSWNMALTCWMSHSCTVTLIADLFHRLKASTTATSATECKTCTASREILKGPVSGVSKDCNVSFKIAKKIVLGQIDWRLCCRLIHASFTGQSTSYTQFSRCSCIHSFNPLCFFFVIQPFNHSVSQLLSDSSTIHLFFHSILTYTHAGHIRSSILPNTLHGACG